MRMKKEKMGLKQRLTDWASERERWQEEDSVVVIIIILLLLMLLLLLQLTINAAVFIVLLVLLCFAFLLSFNSSTHLNNFKRLQSYSTESMHIAVYAYIQFNKWTIFNIDSALYEYQGKSGIYFQEIRVIDDTTTPYSCRRSWVRLEVAAKLCCINTE